jgi:NADH oxidase (H2O2-forming)
MVNVIATMVQRGTSAEDVATMQVGTHPALNASPISYQLTNAAEMALAGVRKSR